MPNTPIELYVDGFVSQHMLRHPEDSAIDEPGARGTVSSCGDRVIRLVVADDRAYDHVSARTSGARTGIVKVFEAARRCDELLRSQAHWEPQRPVRAMVYRDLRALPEAALPEGLSLRPVRRLDDDALEGVALEDAVALALLADPGITESSRSFADHLRSLPPAINLFAAIDDGGTVRATSGAGVFGQEASILFVNTDPSWRARGIGRAMTAAALVAARLAGAQRATLDATDVAASVYMRLGFEDAGRMTRFFGAR
ncbi:MAG TPA: GNAT family N-acetyltransferase [Gaiellaceae bacterium]